MVKIMRKKMSKKGGSVHLPEFSEEVQKELAAFEKRVKQQAKQLKALLQGESLLGIQRIIDDKEIELSKGIDPELLNAGYEVREVPGKARDYLLVKNNSKILFQGYSSKETFEVKLHGAWKLGNIVLLYFSQNYDDGRKYIYRFGYDLRKLEEMPERQRLDI